MLTHFALYKLFKNIVMAYYQHQEIPGRKYVTRGDYDLYFGKTQTRLTQSNWEEIEPQSKIEICINLMDTIFNQLQTCPKCNSSLIDKESIEGWDKW